MSREDCDVEVQLHNEVLALLSPDSFDGPASHSGDRIHESSSPETASEVRS